jgi:hypothetical protein
MAEEVIPAVICGLAWRSTRNRSCWMSWTPETRRWSRMGSLGQLLREPLGSIRSRAKPSFAPASLALNLFARSLLLCIRTCLRERTKPAVSPASRVGPASRCSCFDLRTDKGSSPCMPPPSSSRLTAAFAPQLLLPTCRAISASPPPRGSRELTASSRHLHTLASCRQLALLMLWHWPRRAHSLRLRSPAPL